MDPINEIGLHQSQTLDVEAKIYEKDGYDTQETKYVIPKYHSGVFSFRQQLNLFSNRLFFFALFRFCLDGKISPKIFTLRNISPPIGYASQCENFSPNFTI